jgi:hypothetical protein
VTSFGVVAPLALMAVSINLVWKWVIETLGTLAERLDDHNARLRGTLAAFLQDKRQLQGRRRTTDAAQEHRPVPDPQAEESFGCPVSEDCLHIELALLAS